MPSAFDHASVIDACLATEVLCGWVAGPSTAVCRFNLHISRFRMVPESNQPRKWCLILDLASPDGNSVNDGISKTHSSTLLIASWPEAVALMAKFDVASAYRNAAMHPLDRQLLGMN